MKTLQSCMFAALLALIAFPASAACTVKNIEVRNEVFLRSPGCVQARVLAPNVAENIAVPATANFVVFESECAFYANYDATAVAPAADVTDGSGSEYSPTQRFVTGVTNISVVASSACNLSVAFFRS